MDFQLINDAFKNLHEVELLRQALERQVHIDYENSIVYRLAYAALINTAKKRVAAQSGALANKTNKDKRRSSVIALADGLMNGRSKPFHSWAELARAVQGTMFGSKFDEKTIVNYLREVNYPVGK